ncbi:hypothetical protein NC653_029983 [Populus alba x Populus x berolinensis]|uniref:Uncharacterized protein n=1 Tax=Populus alba x Populus x berolinensis TaxID=444605 RepID=A0AAD6M3S7_9ROSI|nr:hypothetical protein NC653_029983 [Populus alba x Populus x berolinensis]
MWPAGYPLAGSSPLKTPSRPKKLGNETDAKNSNDGCSQKDLLGLLLQDHRACRLSSSWWPRDHSIGSIDHGHCCRVAKQIERGD